MLELKNIYKKYDSKTVLENISLTVPDSGTICICGPSGSGKTTIMRIIAGLEKVDSGEVLRKGKNRLAVVFQEDRLLNWKTAVENITAVCNDRERALHYLELTGLLNDAEKYPQQLSGGMKRRLSCARALAFGGDMYIFDEPLTGLDDSLRLKMLGLIKAETSGKATVMITHDVDAADILNAKVYTIG